VNGAGWLTRIISWVSGVVDKYGVDGVVNAVANGILFSGRHLRKIQTGLIQSYLYLAVGGLLIVILFKFI
ncbi:MAG: NADH-quinone oxidoreductase subunit M, partial [bacterium]|nr:NADH-quinone oxidoreductase subunit M [bacterium]